MKVRCICLLDSHGKPEIRSQWLTIGRIYLVLEVIHGTDDRWLFRLMGDAPNGAGLFQIEQFEPVTADIPSNWQIRWETNGVLVLSPSAWCHPGFWERYYDRENDAVRAFEDERTKILNADL